MLKLPCAYIAYVALERYTQNNLSQHVCLIFVMASMCAICDELAIVKLFSWHTLHSLTPYRNSVMEGEVLWLLDNKLPDALI